MPLPLKLLARAGLCRERDLPGTQEQRAWGLRGRGVLPLESPRMTFCVQCFGTERQTWQVRSILFMRRWL